MRSENGQAGNRIRKVGDSSGDRMISEDKSDRSKRGEVVDGLEVIWIHSENSSPTEILNWNWNLLSYKCK